MLGLDDIVILFFLAYISPSYLLLSSPGSLLASARSLDLSEYQRDTHVLNYHRSRESSLLTFLLRNGHFPYEHPAALYRQLFRRKDATIESDRSIGQECDHSRKPIRKEPRTDVSVPTTSHQGNCCRHENPETRIFGKLALDQRERLAGRYI